MITNIFALALVTLSGLLLQKHWAMLAEPGDSREDHRSTEPPSTGWSLSRQQSVRRCIASGAIGFVGFALLCWPIIPRNPAPMGFFLLLIVTATGMMLVIAIFDIRDTRQRFRAARQAAQEELVEQLSKQQVRFASHAGNQERDDSSTASSSS